MRDIRFYDYGALHEDPPGVVRGLFEDRPAEIREFAHVELPKGEDFERSGKTPFLLLFAGDTPRAVTCLYNVTLEEFAEAERTAGKDDVIDITLYQLIRAPVLSEKPVLSPVARRRLDDVVRALNSGLDL